MRWPISPAAIALGTVATAALMVMFGGGATPANVSVATATSDNSNPQSDNKPTGKEESPNMSTAQANAETHGKVYHVDTEDFQKEVLQSKVPVLVDFYADWCGPCRMLAPVLDQVAKQNPEAKVVKVNVDHSPQLAGKYGVSSIPTLIVVKEGEVTARQSGLADAASLQRMLTR